MKCKHLLLYRWAHHISSGARIEWCLCCNQMRKRDYKTFQWGVWRPLWVQKS